MTSPYERVIDALAGHVQVRDQGSTARAQCPSHGSRGLSLAVRSGVTDDGRAKASLMCFGGCEADDVLAAVGLGISDLYEPATGPREYVPLRRPQYDLGKAGTHDLETLANHLADRSAQHTLAATLGPEILAISDVGMLADLYLGGTDERD